MLVMGVIALNYTTKTLNQQEITNTINSPNYKLMLETKDYVITGVVIGIGYLIIKGKR